MPNLFRHPISKVYNMEVSLSCEILKQVQDDFKFSSSSRQQISFGRKRAEQWWPVRLQRHSKFLLKREVDANEVGQNNCSLGSARFAG